jgi:hypothetical protein
MNRFFLRHGGDQAQYFFAEYPVLSADFVGFQEAVFEQAFYRARTDFEQFFGLVGRIYAIWSYFFIHINIIFQVSRGVKRGQTSHNVKHIAHYK